MENIELLFHKYKDDVYRLAVSYTRSRQDAEDVCQNVFLKLMKQPQIDPGKEKSWLMQVTANECRSLLRSHWWRTTVPIEDTLSVSGPETSGVLEALMQLDPKYRVVVYLHYYEGFHTSEIAGLLKISQSAVTTRLSRARRELKSILQEDEK
jgi:RNA polymerase sigma-70 factor (ECF subfamily)